MTVALMSESMIWEGKEPGMVTEGHGVQGSFPISGFVRNRKGDCLSKRHRGRVPTEQVQSS